MKAQAIIQEFFVFGYKQMLSCVFAGSFLFILAVSRNTNISGLERYDFLFLSAIIIQLLLVMLGIETWREVAVLSSFHLIGMLLELFKTSPAIHSWSYPEPAFFRIGTVPLYSGFMYAAVASYIMQAWRLFDLQLEYTPTSWKSFTICALIYGNFFTNHYIHDLRWGLSLAIFSLFRRTRVYFTVTCQRRQMPLVLAFTLIGFFIWIAENIATFFGAWTYPGQAHGWSLVSANKITSWMLLVIISFIIVAVLKGRSHTNERPAIIKDGQQPIAVLTDKQPPRPAAVSEALADQITSSSARRRRP